jgi:twinkle protein
MLQRPAPNDIGRLADKLSLGQHKKKCPECHHTRSKHKHDKSLSLSIDSDGVRYHCHHCGINGGWMYEQAPAQPLNPPKGTNRIVQEYLKSRNIDDDIIASHTLQGTYSFNGKVLPSVGFPYFDGSGVAAIKWRSADTTKMYSQENVCQDFFNLHSYVKGNDILLVEGEMDALSWLSCELPKDLTVMSIPNGAPAKVKDGKVDPRDDKKFQYVWRAKKELESANRIILCFDNDEAGFALRDEIVRRIGTSKVWTMDLEDHKDTSEALDKKGTGYLLGQLEVCDPYPTVGLYQAKEFRKDYDLLYEEGQIQGASTGIQSLDKLIQIVPGMMSIVTGFPSSGKSDLIDQICLNLARSEGLKTAYCSFEKPPALHMAQLAQKLMNQPFFEGPSPRMAMEAKDYAQEWINDHFLFMDHTLDGPTSIDGILDVASASVMQMGCRSLVIDPYNFIELPPSDRETDSINKMLTKVQKWAKSHFAHVFFIAHPTKLAPDRRSEKKVVVTGHDIAGSASWFAKADLGYTVWRHPRDEKPPEIHVWKVRWNWIGKNGYCKLNFDPPTGRWSDHVREIPDTGQWDW